MLNWRQVCNGLNLTGVGRQDLLELPITALFASRQCSGAAIRAAMQWAMQQARERIVVASGFHAPLEQSVLKLLLEARSPVVVMLARPVQGARLSPPWTGSLAQGSLAVVSTAKVVARLTNKSAAVRNDQVAQLATRIVVAHASPGGGLAALCDQWRQAGRSVESLLTVVT